MIITNQPTNKIPLIIIDYDDTLISSTWLFRQFSNGGNTIALGKVAIDSCSPAIKAELDASDLAASAFVSELTKLGIVIVVSNGTHEWIKGSMSTYYPNLQSCLQEHEISVISARDEYQHVYTDSFQWKLACFKKHIDIHNSKGPIGTAAVVSIGDGLDERNSTIHLSYVLNFVSITFKLMPMTRPSLLIEQQKAVVKSISQNHHPLSSGSTDTAKRNYSFLCRISNEHESIDICSDTEPQTESITISSEPNVRIFEDISSEIMHEKSDLFGQKHLADEVLFGVTDEADRMSLNSMTCEPVEDSFHWLTTQDDCSHHHDTEIGHFSLDDGDLSSYSSSPTSLAFTLHDCEHLLGEELHRLLQTIPSAQETARRLQHGDWFSRSRSSGSHSHSHSHRSLSHSYSDISSANSSRSSAHSDKDDEHHDTISNQQTHCNHSADDHREVHGIDDIATSQDTSALLSPTLKSRCPSSSSSALHRSDCLDALFDWGEGITIDHELRASQVYGQQATNTHR